MRIYGAWLTGQFAGMGDGLNLQAVDLALHYERVRKSKRSGLAARLNLLHGILMEQLKLEKGDG